MSSNIWLYGSFVYFLYPDALLEAILAPTIDEVLIRSSPW